MSGSQYLILICVANTEFWGNELILCDHLHVSNAQITNHLQTNIGPDLDARNKLIMLAPAYQPIEVLMLQIHHYRLCTLSQTE